MRLLHLVLAAATLSGSLAAHADVVTFAGLGGTNDTVFHTYTDGVFTVASHTGVFFDGKVFGDPVPSIYGGLFDSGISASSVLITANSGGLFDFTQVDLAQDLFAGTYTFIGKDGSTTLFTQSGTLYTPNFKTFTSQYSTTGITSLEIALTGPDYNIDNIHLTPVVTTSPVPEPGSLALLSTGLVGALGTLRRKLARDVA